MYVKLYIAKSHAEKFALEENKSGLVNHLLDLHYAGKADTLPGAVVGALLTREARASVALSRAEEDGVGQTHNDPSAIRLPVCRACGWALADGKCPNKKCKNFLR